MVVNNGVIIQFGAYNTAIAKDVEGLSITLPINYSNTKYSVQVQVLQTEATGYYNNLTITGRTSTVFKFGNDGYAVNAGMIWMSIGF